MNQKTLLAVVLFIALVTLTRADIPVHCEIQQIVGKWTFFLTESNHNKSIIQICDMKMPLPPVVKEYVVTLSLPNVATDEQGNKGTWTLAYDEAFDVVIGGKKYFAFFNYTRHIFKIISHCDQTFTGTFHDEGINPKNWGCFRGRQHKVVPPFEYESEVPKLMESYKSTKFHNNQTYIDLINKSQNLWQATSYPEFEGLTYLQMQQKAGRLLPRVKREGRQKTIEFMRQFNSKKRVNAPESWDWRNVNGVSYVGNVRDQKQCGSCYAFGTTGMLESRVRVLTNNTQKPIYSVQEIVSCSKYAQGCDGGLELLIEKYGEDYGLYNDQCYPYHATHSKCNNKCVTDDVTYVTNYTYIGGYYGGCNEEAMIEHLVRDGPLVVGFFVKQDFFHYKSGIYRNHFTGEEKFVPVNHAVLLVGYGKSGSTKYWICRNSWGSGWGDRGYFKIVRGSNHCGMESEASVAFPVLK